MARRNEHGQEDTSRWNVSYDDDIELNKRRQHPTIAWLWRLETCDPSERPELLAKYEEWNQLHEEKKRNAKGWEHRSFYPLLDFDDIGRTVMQRATPRQWR
ncbi:hypothetical protein NKH34_15040 [Mesorhizobium sp. M1148]|uniref:hypothetical protein n=1 Tax=unclassified Mesorhizobium TaxID=325217 RepID=UPI0003CE508D|nr:MULTISPECIES: hypothetical protein [unclassified Mesorhizobium]ESY28144.1 hypothetical protein X747_32660 [Mesorhizobium sp. LNJC384A00]